MTNNEFNCITAVLPDFALGTFTRGKKCPRIYYRHTENYDEILENNRAFLPLHGAGPERLVTADQKHTARVHVVTEEHMERLAAGGDDLKRELIPETDGLVTNIPGAVLAVYVADCSAVFLADPVSKSIGLCHAGRKGALSKICLEAVRKMQEEYGARPENIRAWIAPCICRDCYEVGPETAAEVSQAWGETVVPEDWGETGVSQAWGEKADAGRTMAEEVIWMNPETGREHFDLKKANELVLLEAGLKPEHIVVAPECTCCNNNCIGSNEEFYSFRRDGGIISEQGAYLSIK